VIGFGEKKKVKTFLKMKKLNRTSGVWSIWGSNENDRRICLDVHQTINIGKEMKWIWKRSLDGKRVRKYQHIFSGYKEIIFKVVALNIENLEERQQIETDYACKNNALYWNGSFEGVEDVGGSE